MKKRPSYGDYIRRVGGFFFLVFSFILMAKYLYPGYEVYASLFACAIGVIFLLVEDIIKRRRKK